LKTPKTRFAVEVQKKSAQVNVCAYFFVFLQVDILK
jgi:hypothetical protein